VAVYSQLKGRLVTIHGNIIVLVYRAKVVAEKVDKKWLAYRIYPEPSGTEYQYSNLMNKAEVECLFDYCQVLEAMISRDGWKVLIDYYGFQGLYEINEKSGWFDCDNLEEFIFEVESHIDSLHEV
jgi:hypothetical protein